MPPKASEKAPLKARDDDDDQEMGVINAPEPENPIPRLADEDDEEDEEADESVSDAASDGSTLLVRNAKAPLSSIIPANPLHVLNVGALFSLFLLCAAVVVSLATLGTQVASRQNEAEIAQAEFGPLRSMHRLDDAALTVYRYLLFGNNLLWAAGAVDDGTLTSLDGIKIIQLSAAAQVVRDSVWDAVKESSALFERARLNSKDGGLPVKAALGTNFSSLAAAMYDEVVDYIIPFVALGFRSRRLFSTSQRANRIRMMEINNIAVAQGSISGLGILRKLFQSCSVLPVCNASSAMETLQDLTLNYTRVTGTLIRGTQIFLGWIDSPQVAPTLVVSEAVAFLSSKVSTEASNIRQRAFEALVIQQQINSLLALEDLGIGNATIGQRGIRFVSTVEDLKALSTVCGQLYTSLMLLRSSIRTWADGAQAAWIALGIARRFDFSTPFFPISQTDTDAASGLKYLGSPLVTTTGFMTYNDSELDRISGNVSLLSAFHTKVRTGYTADILVKQERSRRQALISESTDPVRDAAVWKIQTVLAVSIVLPALAVLYVMYGVSLRLASSPLPYSHFVLGILVCYGLHIAVCISVGMIAKNAVEVPPVFTSRLAAQIANDTSLIIAGQEAANLLGTSALVAAQQPGRPFRNALQARVISLQALPQENAPWAAKAIAGIQDELKLSVFARRDSISTSGTYRERSDGLQLSNATICEEMLSMSLRQLTIETMFYSWRRDEFMLLRQFQVQNRQLGPLVAAEALRVTLCAQCGASFPSDYCQTSIPQALLAPGQQGMYRVFSNTGREGTSVSNWRETHNAVRAQAEKVYNGVASLFDAEQLAFVQARRLIVWLSVFGIALIQGIIYVIGLRTFGPSVSSMLP
jgi:hypothetical protein